MIIRLKCVMMDGATPETGDPLVPFVQNLVGSSLLLPAVPAGVDVDFVLDFVGQDNQPFDMTGYVGVLTLRKTSSETDSLFANAITFSGSTGSSFATGNDTDIEPRGYAYDVVVISPTDKRDQPVPASKIKITPVIGDTDDGVTPKGPDMLLVGIPSPSQEDVDNDRVLGVTSSDPLTLAWVDKA